MHRLIFVGFFVGICAAVPVVCHEHPALFDTLVRTVFPHAGQPEPARERLTVARVEPSRKAEVLPGKKVRIPADRSGHFRGAFRLNGRMVEALVDTGATLVAINRSTARRIGLAVSPADFRHVVDTANGKARAAVAEIGSLQIGRIYVEDVQAVVLDDEALDTVLIGMAFLNRLSRYAVENGSLLLEQ